MKKSKVKHKVELFLDSGAFSAWSQKVEIDIQDYIRFIKKHKKYISIYANLDVIGDHKATLKNQKIMEKAGLKPMPCFHQGEPIEVLKHYVDNYEYISIGGLVSTGISKKSVATDLDTYFDYICDTKNRLPKVKVHGFGVGSVKFMTRYPWYSVDSSSWMATGRTGAIFVPRRKSGKWSYKGTALKVIVSTRSPTRKDAGQHVDTYPPNEQRMIIRYLEEQGYVLGKSKFKKKNKNYTLKKNERWSGKAEGKRREVEVLIEDGVSNSYKKRDELNIIYFQELEKTVPEWPWAWEIGLQKGGFGL